MSEKSIEKVEEKKSLSLKTLKATHYGTVTNLINKLELDKNIIKTASDKFQAALLKLVKRKKITNLDNEAEDLVKNNLSKELLDMQNVIVNELMSKVGNAENDVIKLLVELSELNEKEIKELTLLEYRNMIKALVNDSGFTGMLI